MTSKKAKEVIGIQKLNTSKLAAISLTSAPLTVGALTICHPSMFTTAANTASDSQRLTISNTSSTDTIDISVTNVSGEEFASFDITPCNTPALLPGTTCDVNVTYKPKSVGNASVTMTLSATDRTTGSTQTLPITLEGVASAVCAQPTQWWLPLSHPGVTNATINCYYNATNNVAFATEAQYLYNPSGSANTISGTLASLQFPGGVQLSLAGNASTGSCSSGTTDTGQIHPRRRIPVAVRRTLAQVPLHWSRTFKR